MTIKAYIIADDEDCLDLEIRPWEDKTISFTILNQEDRKELRNITISFDDLNKLMHIIEFPEEEQ